MRIVHCAAAGFESARRLASDEAHGHSFTVSAHAATGLASLRARLHEVTQALDYRDLNQVLPSPDDAALADWIAARLPMAADLVLRSAPDRGVERDADGTRRVWLKSGFEAAHQLPHVPAGHQCGRLHGHGFGVRLLADADRQDIAALQAAWAPLHAQLNHAYLNALPGLDNPTSENLAAWLWQRLGAVVPGLCAVDVFETATAGSRYDGHRFRIWKEMRFEAAVPFDGHGRYTGHSYLVRLHLAGQVDARGWVRDFGEVKARFKPCYARLDHHPLDQLPGIGATDCAGIAGWIAAQFAAGVPELCRVDVLENDHDGAECRLAGEEA